MEVVAVETDDAGRLLAAVLQRVQAERGHGGGIGHAPDTEHAALLVEFVVATRDVGRKDATYRRRTLGVSSCGEVTAMPALSRSASGYCPRPVPGASPATTPRPPLTARGRSADPRTEVGRQLVHHPLGATIDRPNRFGVQHRFWPAIHLHNHPSHDIGKDDTRTPHRAEYQTQRAVEAADRRGPHQPADPAGDQHQHDQAEDEHHSEGDGIDPGRRCPATPGTAAARAAVPRRRRKSRRPRRRGRAPRAPARA